MDVFTRFGMLIVALAIVVGLVAFAASVLRQSTQIELEAEQTIFGDETRIVSQLERLCTECVSDTDRDCFFVKITNQDPDFALDPYHLLSSNDFIYNGENSLKVSSKNNICTVSVFG